MKIESPLFSYFLPFCLLVSFSYLSSQEKIVIHLLATNDIHGTIAEDKAYWLNQEYPPDLIGAAGFSKYIKELRMEALENDEGILIVDGGNFFQGTPIGMFDNGKTMVEWFNYIGYDALSPGRYDFISGTSNLNDLINLANFPFLGANLKCNECPLISQNFKPYIIQDVQGIKIGILGIINSKIHELVLSENLQGVNILNEKPTLEKWIPIVKQQGAEIIIVLTSSSIPWDREEVYEDFISKLETNNSDSLSLNAIEMGYFAQGADIIVSGGESKGYRTLWYDPYSHVYSVQNYGNSFSHLLLSIDNEFHSLTDVKTAIDGDVSQSLLSDDFQPDMEALQWIRDREEIAMSANYGGQKHNPKKKNDNKSIQQFPYDNWNFPNLNRNNSIEIITWNCEFFPHANDSTILALAEAVSDFNVDIIAFQELRRTGWFSKLMAYLPEYDFIVSKQASFMDLAIIYKNNMFELTRQIEPFAENDYNFAGRPPLQADLILTEDGKNIPLSVINLHMKCCDSGLERRKKASQMLHEYLDEHYDEQSNIIVLGDWNDDTKDSPGEHCFEPFFQDNRFYFTTQEIALDSSQASYPNEPYVSFLDHIMVSEKILPKGSQYDVQAILMGDFMGGYPIYEAYISDHLPVMLSFRLQTNTD